MTEDRARLLNQSLPPLTPERRDMLIDFIRAYVPFTPQEQAEFDALLEMPEYAALKAYHQARCTPGFERSKRQKIERFLEVKFGALSPVARQKFENYSEEALDNLFRTACATKSLTDLGLED